MAAYYTISMYPVQFSVDYPDRSLDRKSTLLRVFYVLPIWVVLAFMSGTTYAFGLEKVSLASAQVGGVLFVPIVLMLLFQNKYHRWWSRALTREGTWGPALSIRVRCLLLLRLP